MVDSAFLIHGAYGNPDENWFPWLKEKLAYDGVTVYAPQFPIGDLQSLESWTRRFDEYLQVMTENAIMIGHSIGPAFILSVLEKLDFTIQAAFLVAPFVSKLGNDEYDSVNETFYKNYDWNRIKKNCKQFFVYYSDNDPYVPMDRGKYVAGKLGVKPTIIPVGGHLNEAAGFKEFPQLYADIEKLLE